MFKNLGLLAAVTGLAIASAPGCASSWPRPRAGERDAATARRDRAKDRGTGGWPHALLSPRALAGNVRDLSTASAFDWDFRRVPWLVMSWDY